MPMGKFTYVYTMACLWISENSLPGIVFTFCHVGPRIKLRSSGFLANTFTSQAVAMVRAPAATVCPFLFSFSGIGEHRTSSEVL